MPNFTRRRGGGLWTGTLLPADMAALDAKQFAAVNGTRGGCWAPTSAITIAGAQALEVTGPLYLDSAIQLYLSGTTRLQYDPDEIHTCEIPLFDGGWPEVNSWELTDAISANLTVPVWQQALIFADRQLYFPLVLPDTATLLSVSASMTASTAHAASDPLPTSMPAVSVNWSSHDIATFLAGSKSRGRDTSATMAEYRSLHEVTWTPPAPLPYDPDMIWSIVVTGESGAGAATGLMLWSLRARFKLTAHDEFIV